MRARGMTYDTGFVKHGRNSRERLDPAVVRRELAIIRDDLHCNAVQITGGDPGRLESAAAAAAELGLTEGVDSAFVYLFSLAGFPYRPDGDPRDDLDRAGLGIVKMLESGRGQAYPDMEWEPKAAFAAVAERYRG